MGFFERDAPVFPACVGIAPAEVGVVVVRGHVVAAGFYPFGFAFFVYAVGDLAFVPNCLFALVVGFFVADEMLGTDESHVMPLLVAFGTRMLFVGGADDEPSRPA